MSFERFVAWRYFLSERKQSFINIISWLSIISVAFCTAALIIVLSVFNGFSDLLHSLYNSFDPELKIEAHRGKTFLSTPQLLETARAVEGVEVVTEVIEDYAYLRYGDADMVVKFKGMGDNFAAQRRLEGRITQGVMKLTEGGKNYAVVGRGVQHALSININDDFRGLRVFYVKGENARSGTLDPSRLYAEKSIKPAGIFSIEKNHDENYILLPLGFAQALSGYGNRRTSLEVKVAAGNAVNDVQASLQRSLGADFRVLNQEEQQKDLYRLLRVEKLFTFLALSLLILIGSLNTFFSLMMLALDKRKDLAIMMAMGAEQKSIRRIFFLEGAMISAVGSTAGLILGAGACLLQKQFGLVGLGMENAVVSSYPVHLLWSDLAAVGCVIAPIVALMSFYPGMRAAQRPIALLL